MTLSEESWLAKALIAIHKDNGAPVVFLYAVADYVGVACAGLIFSSIFLLVEQKTRQGWAGIAAAVSFVFLVFMIGILMLDAFWFEQPTVSAS